MNPEPQGALRHRWLPGAALVACTYVYFLLFAQFAFLELARRGAGADLRPVLAAQGLAGIAGSILAALAYTPRGAPAWLAAALLGCAAAAALAPFARGPVPFALIAAATGLALGVATVTLATSLRSITAPRRLGLACGLGTGAAYGLCSLPGIFAAPPAAQCALAVLAGLAGAGLSLRLPGVPAAATSPTAPVPSGVVVPAVAALLALVTLDSAAFYVIQHTPALKSGAWSGGGWQFALAAAHLLAAVLAGWSLDRGHLRLPLLGAALLLAGTCLRLEQPAPWLGPLYAAGVSLYSAALVHFPARPARPWLAALVFALCGWTGSGLGLGLAQNLAGVPPAFALGVLALVAAALPGLRRAGPAALAAAATLLALPAADAAEPDLVAAGREVYIAEGCIHCHSQYVRPGTADEIRWGPARPLSELLAGTPPLPGNRRQGPDLQNVGNRRGAEWNRLHLLAPRRVSPGSTMPAYPHLFAGGHSRGEALLAYLSSLGEDTLETRLAQVAAWMPDPRAQPRPPAAQRQLFLRLCAGCHGEAGRGDGPLARQLAGRPRDLAHEPWLRLGAPADARDERQALARVIKFGLPGTAMAGHEYLPDEAVVSLAAYVQSLHSAAPSP